MKRHIVLTALTALALFFGNSFLIPEKVAAHCDGLDGPVVKAAQQAMETENANPVLIWVQKRDEAEIKETFQKTLAVRQLSPEAKDLAERYFFETLVRLHRAGEGASYTGLKPAGRDLGPAIPAADKTLEDGSADTLMQLLMVTMHEGLLNQFKQVMAKRHFDPNDVEAGRAYVQAYVPYIHYVERLYEAAKSSPHGHFPESEAGGVRQ
ncbi:MAG TPA: DUF6448 family protein [Alphaproteobacteria bacterium]|nr:DUF6448 family protein [Alphaproteobacteria bacterium]